MRSALVTALAGRWVFAARNGHPHAIFHLTNISKQPISVLVSENRGGYMSTALGSRSGRVILQAGVK